MSVKKSRYRRKNAEGLYDTYHFETEVDQVNGLDDYMLEKMKKIAEHNANDTAHANGISGNAATATRLKPILTGSRNQCWLLCKLPKAATALVHYKILGAQYYDQYSTLEVAIKNGFGWCKYVGTNTNWQVYVRAYDTGTSIDVYLFAPGYCDFWELFLQKNGAATEFAYQKVGDATYVPAGTLVCDTSTGLGMDGVELFNGKEKASGMPLGSVMPFLSKTPPPGWLALDTGAIVSRATYAELWAWVQANAPLISEAEWQAQAAEQSSVGAYSTGDGSTTFRLPRIVDYVRGGLQSEVGGWQGDAIRNITGSLDGRGSSPSISIFRSATGAFSVTNKVPYFPQQGSDNSSVYGGFKFDISTIVPTADENRPKTVKFLYCVKAFNAKTNQGLIDITALANEVAGLSADINNSLAIIYPNGGTAASPATIAVNSRYVMNNPFVGYDVLCQVQCLVDSKWVTIDWTGGYTNTSSYGCGARATLYDNNIVLQTGSYGTLIHSANLQGHALGGNNVNFASAPARILVLKIGKAVKG